VGEVDNSLTVTVADRMNISKQKYAYSVYSIQNNKVTAQELGEGTNEQRSPQSFLKNSDV